jgi:hypothetical protein
MANEAKGSNNGASIEKPMPTGVGGESIESPFYGDKVTNQEGSTAGGDPWWKVLRRAKITALLASAVVITLILALIFSAFYWFSVRQKKATAPQAVDGQNFKHVPATTLGEEGETLTVGADSIFKGKVAVNDIDVSGKINSGSPLVVSRLEVAEGITLSTADVRSNLNVGGTSTLQGNVTVANLLTVNGNSNVTGNGSFGGNLTAGNLTVRGATVAGTLTLGGHVISGGATPSVSGGSAVGSAGTVSISGNDRAGTIQINTGTGPAPGTLATVTFRSPYGSSPRIVISPVGSGTGALQYYLSKFNGGFTISTLSAPPPGAGFSFDYIVEQ